MEKSSENPTWITGKSNLGYLVRTEKFTCIFEVGLVENLDSIKILPFKIDWWKKIYLIMSCVLYNKEQIALASYMIKYFKQRPPDCVLFSEDNSKILIHKGKFFSEGDGEMS